MYSRALVTYIRTPPPDQSCTPLPIGLYDVALLIDFSKSLVYFEFFLFVYVGLHHNNTLSFKLCL